MRGVFAAQPQPLQQQLQLAVLQQQQQRQLAGLQLLRSLDLEELGLTFPAELVAQQQQQVQQAPEQVLQQQAELAMQQQQGPEEVQQQQAELPTQQQQQAEPDRQQQAEQLGAAQPEEQQQQHGPFPLRQTRWRPVANVPIAVRAAAAGPRLPRPAAAAAAAGIGWGVPVADPMVWARARAAAAAAAAEAEEVNAGGEPPDVYPVLESDSELLDYREDELDFEDTGDEGEEEEGAEDGTDRCAEALAARLTLLGMCSEQPLLLLLDEADAAMLQQGAGQQTGGLFRAMLLSMLRQLPQVGVRGGV
jgi:hypothetical protein